MYKGFKLTLIFVIYVFHFQFLNSQVERNHLKPLLSNSDQKTIDKIEVTYIKGKNLENEANIISSSGTTDKEKAKNEKKYILKRLEAAQLYQKANADLLEFFKDNISKFWKENKNSKIDPSIKNHEDKANELSRNAKSTRKVAEDLIYPSEKLSKMIEAENLESESIKIFTKVLYAYLNYPITYDSLNKENQSDKEIIKIDTVKPAEKIHEVTSIPDDSLTQKDIIAQPSEIKKDTIGDQSPIISVSPKTENAINPNIENSTSTAQKSIAPKDTSSLYNMMQVKEEQVDKFNKFLEDSYPGKFENYVINFRELNFSDVDSLRSAWIRYNQYQFSPEEIASLKKSKKDSSAMIAEVQVQADSSQNQVEQIVDKVPEKTKTSEEKTADKQIVNNTKTNKQTKKNNNSSKVNNTTATPSESEIAQAEVAKGFIYRVQVSACRIQIDPKSLRAIYGGGLKILELKEDSWYKYAIGEFNTYAEARHLRDAVKIPGAFVIAYLNGKRIQILNNNSQMSAESYATNKDLIYKVQIAASKSQLNKKYINHIYSGSQSIEESYEDKWYKYSIVIGPSLSAAKKFIEDENIPGAFITSYLGNKRIELKDALKINKTKKQ